MREALRLARAQRDLLGRCLTWLCGGALALNLLFVLGILSLLAYHGLASFWQKPLLWLELDDGQRLLGEVWERQEVPVALEEAAGSAGTRIRLKVGNRDVTGADFVWLDESRVGRSAHPADAVLLERLEWGNFYGFPRALRLGGETLASGREETWRALQPVLEAKAAERRAVEEVEEEISDVNYRIDRLRLDARAVELRALPAPEEARRLAEIARQLGPLEARYETLAEELFGRRDALLAERLVMATAAGSEKDVAVGEIVRALRPNALGVGGKLGLYLSRAWELVAGHPRESNTEGGIFPAIFGTVMMVFLMSFAVAPLGVLAALYLREYARQGPLVQTVRIAVNNL
ncbi:MAG TPA: phosphate ABC transporter, permease protein PstA, partial [Thermoanaerobaculia bacterium]|nr:phosphate ABC transporter, permease protein PstA [Thermoanaerobaculia bacterium]